MRAAAHYGVPPWELLERPAAYITMANMLMSADEHAASTRRRHQQQTPWL